MTARPASLRSASPASEDLRLSCGLVRKGTRGWQDKSSAVDRAACGWFFWVISAVWTTTVPSLLLIFCVFSKAKAPSPLVARHG